MLLDYLGCLKTWIYSGISQFWAPSVCSLRLPVIAIGGLTTFLFTNFISRVAGTRAAWLGGCLLASDPVFALTNNFDWGPVALQHFLLISSLLAILNFHASKRAIWLAVASFGFGLALWDKAIFSWILIPIIFSAFLIWPQAFRTHATRRNLAILVASLILGASPLLYFNLRHHWITFRSHLVFSLSDFAQKLTAV